MKRKIAVFTGTRAEYGLLYWIIKGLNERNDAELQLLVGGMHLSPEFGKTISGIIEDGFKVDETLEFLLSSDSPVGIAKSMGLATISAADCFERLKPDLLVVLGDRFESLAVCQAAMVAQIPIAHIHGGEITEGLIDEAVRHSITKMSHIHFTATDTYKERVIQLGESPELVFNFGAPGIDSIKNTKLLDKKTLSKELNFDIEESPYMMVTYHPVTLDKQGAIAGFKNLLKAISLFNNFKFIVTYPNADTFGRGLIEVLDNFKHDNPDQVLLVKSLGQLRYLSALKYSSLVIGNSSSGLIEAPSFNVPTVNIGNRQGGRVKGDTVVSCNDDHESILAAIKQVLTQDFKDRCKHAENPYGNGNSSSQILDKILNIDLEPLIHKRFYDLK